MPQRWQFALPTRIQFGKGSVRKLGATAKEFGQTAMLVGYREQGALEAMYRRAEESLRAAGLKTVPFYEVDADPGGQMIAEGAERATTEGVDVVVGLGGGSAIDAAKGIALLARLGGRMWDYADMNPQRRPVTAMLPLVAVPTTAGTGSEVTGITVFTHSSDVLPGVPLKASIFASAICPQVAIVDPMLTVGSPPRLTAGCAADALGHGIEACISRISDPISAALGARAVGLIVRHLRDAVAAPSDPKPREPLALASMLAGIALNTVAVTLAHAMAQALGALLHIPHGEAVAIGTHAGLRYNKEVCAPIYAELAEQCGLSGGSVDERAERFIEHIGELLRDVGLPDRVAPRDGLPENLVPRLVRHALEVTDVPLTLNPRKVDQAALTAVFRQVCPANQTKKDFRIS